MTKYFPKRQAEAGGNGAGGNGAHTRSAEPPPFTCFGPGTATAQAHLVLSCCQLEYRSAGVQARNTRLHCLRGAPVSFY